MSVLLLLSSSLPSVSFVFRPVAQRQQSGSGKRAVQPRERSVDVACSRWCGGGEKEICGTEQLERMRDLGDLNSILVV